MTSAAAEDNTIDIAKLSDRQKAMLQKMMEMPQPFTFDVIKRVVASARHARTPEELLAAAFSGMSAE